MPLIFQPEVTALESQVTALQSQLAAAQQRITLLNETELLAGGSLEALKGAIAKVTALAPDAIASLKSAVLNLFSGGDDSSDGGNQPDAPEPEPSNNGGAEIVIIPNVIEETDAGAIDPVVQNGYQKLASDDSQAAKTIYACSTLGFLKRTTAASYKYWQLLVSESQDGFLLGQVSFSTKPVAQSKQKGIFYSEAGEVTTAAPGTVELKKYGSGHWRGWLKIEASCEWASPLASLLACQLEDCPSYALTGQLYELSSPWHPMPNDAHIISIEPGVDKSEESCLATDTPSVEAEMPYVELIPVNHRVAYQRRQDGEIICCYVGGNNKARLKDWGSWLCTQHSVGSGFEVRKAERLTAYNHELKIWGMSLKQIERLAETDTTKTPPSRYHVASFPVAERLLAPEIESVPQEVEHVVKAVTLEEAQIEPQGFQVGDKVQVISDRHGAELVGLSGIVTAATKSGAAVEVNNTLRYFCADELATIEKPALPVSLEPTEEELIALASIQPPVYSLNPIGRGGAATNWRARQAAGIGVNLKDCGTGGITTLEEWRQIEADQKAQQAIAVSEEQEIQEGDWVELLVNGDRYQVDSVDNEGVHLITEEGNACAEFDEVKLLFRAPADWKPF